MSDDLKATLGFGLCMALVLLSPFIPAVYGVFSKESARAKDVAAWESNTPTAYLDGRLIEIETLDLSHYNWQYDSENNVVKFSRMNWGRHNSLEYNPGGE